MTRPRTRVLFVGAFPPPARQIFGGMVTSCRALLGSTLPSRVDLDLLDSTQISNPPPPLLVRLALAMARFWSFIVRFEGRRPQVVLLFAGLGASLLEKGAMAWYARVRGVPAIMFPRGTATFQVDRTSASMRAWYRVLFGGAAKIVCQSDRWQQFALQVLGVEPRHAPVIRNWTATRALLNIGAERAASAGSPVRLIFVGWLERDKGVFELLEACGRLVQSHSFTLDLVGDGHAAPELRGVAAERNLTRIVRFRGWLHGAELDAAYREADVFVLPSWAEGFPNAMIEAMAARLAIVVTNVGGIPEVIVDRRGGLLVEPKNVAALHRALAEVIADGDLREQLAAEAYGIARTNFGVEAAVERLLEEIETTAASPGIGVRSHNGHDNGRRNEDDAS